MCETITFWPVVYANPASTVIVLALLSIVILLDEEVAYLSPAAPDDPDVPEDPALPLVPEDVSPPPPPPSPPQPVWPIVPTLCAV